MKRGKGTHWRSKEDLILVEVLTEFIAKGMSIHEAYPTVSDRLKTAGYSRTTAACYSRWNNHLESIYGKAITLAVEKQQENAKKIVAGILENQAPLEVVHTPIPKMILNMPTIPTEEALEMLKSHSNEGMITSVPTITYLPDKIENLNDVISFLQHVSTKLESLQKENEQFIQALEESWEENERLRLEINNYYEQQEKYEFAQQIIQKLESVGS